MPLSAMSAKMPDVVRKRSFWLYVGLFFLAYLIFLLLLLPAAHLLPPNKPDPNSLKTGQVQGTVWQGNIGWARLQDLSATKIEWHFNPWAVFGGVWEYAVDFELDGIPVTGYVAKTLSGAWRIRDAVAGLKLQDTPYIVENMGAMLPGGRLQGDLAMRIERALWVDKWPQQIQGSFLLQNLQFGELPGLGDWKGRIDKKDDKVVLNFSPQSRILQGKGQWVLSTDYQWTFALRLRSGEVVDKELASWLPLLGVPDAEGYYRIQRSGRLK